MFPFIVNYFTLQSGLVRSVLEIIEQPRETADDIATVLRHVLEKNNIDIHQMTSIGADNTNVNFSRHHSVFSMIKSEVPDLLKGNISFKIRIALKIHFFLTGNCYCHILNNSVKNSHQHLLVNVELYLSQLYSHFSSSSKRVVLIKEFFLSDLAKCTLHFLHQVLSDIQIKNLELQRYSTSMADLHRIITPLLKKLNDRLKQNYFGHQTRTLLNSMTQDVQEQLISSFVKYLSSIIK